MYTYDLFEPTNDTDTSLNRLTSEFAPLHVKSWNETKAKRYSKPYDLNVGAFTAMWMNRTLRVFMAYEDGRPVGYLTGFVFRPMQYQASVFQVEDWYTGNNSEMEKGLFDYVLNAVRFMGCEEILITNDVDQPQQELGHGWKRVMRTMTSRFVKE